MSRSNSSSDLLFGLATGLAVGAALVAEPRPSHRVVYYTHSPSWNRWYNVQISGCTSWNELEIDGRRASYGSQHLSRGSHTASIRVNGMTRSKRFDVYDDRVVELEVTFEGDIRLRTHR